MPTFRAATGVLTNGSTSIVGNRPTGTADNDGLLAFVVVRNGGTDDSYGTVTTPAGWTLVTSLEGTSLSQAKVFVYSKIASSEPATWTWTWSLSARAYAFVAGYSSPNLANLIDNFAIQYNSGSDLTCEAPSVTPTSQPGTLVNFYCNGNGKFAGKFDATQSYSSGTERVFSNDNDAGGYFLFGVADENYAALSALTGRVATAGYGDNGPSIGVSVLLRDSAYSGVTTPPVGASIF
jgi:hypothetical protein